LGRRFNFAIAVPMSLPQMFAPNMPVKFVPLLRACCVAGALMLGRVEAVDQKALIGATRAQILARFGTPKSEIVAGSREVLFFTGERIVLRDNVVVEADEVPIETTPPPAPPPPAASTSSTDESATSTTKASSESRWTPANQSADTNDGTTTPSKKSDTAAKEATSAPVTPAKPAEPELKILSVRPPSRTFAQPAPSNPEPAAPSAPAPAAAAPSPAPASSPSQAPSSVSVAPENSAPSAAAERREEVKQPSPAAAATPATAPANAAPVAAGAETPAAATATPSSGATAPTVASTTTAAAAAAPAIPPGKVTVPNAAAPAKSTRNAYAAIEHTDAVSSIFTARTYAIAFVIIVGGIAYIVWRRKQRDLALMATAVSRPPFAAAAAPAAPGAGTRFTPELLTRIEWKRFEELVAAYYNKTGVVAARTKTGLASPVHIRISWKGEPRPFACVQCVPHPTGLIEAKAIQALCDVLAAEDIRRGYVVTSGKFSVSARDLAEEKHITLLSGDIFLEKLNALPEPVRAELMRDVTAGDFTTPTCPQCESKMARSTVDSSMWQCPQCGSVLPRI
jgi:hypothetical protein